MLFIEKSMCVRFFNLPIPNGILWVKLSVLISSLVKEIRVSIEVGIRPEYRFSNKPNVDRSKALIKTKI